MVPEFAYSQDFARDFMASQFDEGSLAQRLIRRMYPASGIENRYSVIPDFGYQENTELMFFEVDQNGRYRSPGTKARNDAYIRASKPMFELAARQAISNSTYSISEITHVITVSCTGFFAPGPDYHIVRSLGLTPTTQRLHVGFMGCYGAFPGLRTAKDIIRSDSNAKVLLVCLELCSIHIKFEENPDLLISGSVFADGAGACVLSSSQKTEMDFQLLGFASTLTSEGEADMAWTIGDTGFDMVLSSYVPKILGSEIQPELRRAVEENGMSLSDIQHWAIHPGGRAILDKIEDAMGLNEEDLKFSRDVLRKYGNMSSATVLFVLKAMQQSKTLRAEEHILASAFGPGLTVESGILAVL